MVECMEAQWLGVEVGRSRGFCCRKIDLVGGWGEIQSMLYSVGGEGRGKKGSWRYVLVSVTNR